MRAERLEASLDHAVEHNPNLIEDFYTLLFERHPQVRSLFGRNSAQQQAQMLTEAISMLVAHVEDESFVRQTMMAIGRKHLDYGVEDHMYPWVSACLFHVLEASSGTAWSDELAEAWKGVLTTISELAIDGANEARRELRWANTWPTASAGTTSSRV